jgi:hypothetical protein
MSGHDKKKLPLTAYPLNGRRMQLKHIDHLLLKSCMSNAYHDINNPNSEIHKQIKKLLDHSSVDEIIDSFVNWYEDIGCRMNEDIKIAGFTGRTRDEEKHQLDAIVRYSRDHIRIDNDKINVI